LRGEIIEVAGILAIDMGASVEGAEITRKLWMGSQIGKQEKAIQRGQGNPTGARTGSQDRPSLYCYRLFAFDTCGTHEVRRATWVIEGQTVQSGKSDGDNQRGLDETGTAANVSLKFLKLVALGRVELPTFGLGNDPSYPSTTT